MWNLSCLAGLSEFIAIMLNVCLLLLTARRYNLVGVTRRKHRTGSRYFSQKAVTVQGGYGVCFCRQAQVLVRYTRVAVQS